MKTFNDKDFLLNNETGKRLYHEFAKSMRIFDYHSHLLIKDIYDDRHFDNIVTLWLADGKSGDHYKWRVMRAHGVEEKYITGDASNYEKFLKWAETLPYLIGNPLYHWTHLELKQFFGIEETLNKDNAKEIYNKMNSFVKSHGVRSLIEMSNVKVICTTDDPIDNLKYHELLKQDKSLTFSVYPTFRPDKVLKIGNENFKEYVKELSEVSNVNIVSLSDLLLALETRIKYFKDHGCFISDHSLENVNYAFASNKEANGIFLKAMNKEPISDEEMGKYNYYMLVALGRMYHKYNLAMQYHINAHRNNSTRLLNDVGVDAGGDSINDTPIIPGLSLVLDTLDETNELPRSIVYSLNPSDLEALATLIYSYPSDGIKGKMQLGSAWWFLDNKDGMEKQLKTLANMGVLGDFIGMLTDSRSFLSFSRHDYFRRVLCNLLGELIEKGEYPNDIDFVGKVVKDICFDNANKYFLGD